MASISICPEITQTYHFSKWHAKLRRRRATTEQTLCFHAHTCLARSIGFEFHRLVATSTFHRLVATNSCTAPDARIISYVRFAYDIGPPWRPTRHREHLPLMSGEGQKQNKTFPKSRLSCHDPGNEGRWGKGAGRPALPVKLMVDPSITVP